MGGLIEWLVKQAIQKTVNGFVTKNEITQSQADEITAGTMAELQLALELYQKSQQSVPTPPTE